MSITPVSTRIIRDTLDGSRAKTEDEYTKKQLAFKLNEAIKAINRLERIINGMERGTGRLK